MAQTAMDEQNRSSGTIGGVVHLDAVDLRVASFVAMTLQDEGVRFAPTGTEHAGQFWALSGDRGCGREATSSTASSTQDDAASGTTPRPGR